MGHKHWRVRFNMVWVATYYCRVPSLVEGVYGRALKDKSKQVRQKVLSDIITTRFKVMLPVLQSKLTEEIAEDFRLEINRTIDFLKGKIVTIEGARWRLIEHGDGWAISLVH